jgi:hypothetical protein
MREQLRAIELPPDWGHVAVHRMFPWPEQVPPVERVSRGGQLIHSALIQMFGQVERGRDGTTKADTMYEMRFGTSPCDTESFSTLSRDDLIQQVGQTWVEMAEQQILTGMRAALVTSAPVSARGEGVTQSDSEVDSHRLVTLLQVLVVPASVTYVSIKRTFLWPDNVPPWQEWWDVPDTNERVRVPALRVRILGSIAQGELEHGKRRVHCQYTVDYGYCLEELRFHRNWARSDLVTRAGGAWVEAAEQQVLAAIEAAMTT